MAVTQMRNSQFPQIRTNSVTKRTTEEAKSSIPNCTGEPKQGKITKGETTCLTLLAGEQS